ncbi:MAG: hypothetical protein JW833_16640, partial [Prolixibacteraceae bacterium]|nr:hypothetical protein [Prolixibacteraceae bacterium]
MQIKISTANAETIEKLIDSIPEFDPTPIEEIEKRIFRKNVKLFIAIENSEIAGFIVAYENSDKVLYNWLTGVLKEYR